MVNNTTGAVTDVVTVKKLNLTAESEVTGVAEPGYDISLSSKLIINGTNP